MKKLLAFAIVGILSSTASFAAVGVQGKVDCKEILNNIRAAKSAATGAAGAPAPTPGGPASNGTDAK
jgi:ribosomal protein L12E/L44/L45/RPP1/RPP2